jgi:hypothetical protein
MLAINTANSWGASSTVSVAAANTVEGGSKVSNTASTGGATISTLARQLGEAAERAAARDAGKTRSQLAALDKSLKDEVAGDSYFANRASANVEVPDTDDPELLARAKQATEFVNGRGTNPFAGMSREQLALIFYDKGDAFTLNERHAAFSEYQKQELAWKHTVVAQAQNEERTTGTFTNFYKACIAEYQAGSAIEQSSYHPNYVGRMEHYIRFWENGGRGEENVSDYWKNQMEAWMRRLPSSFGDDYSEGDKLWGAAPRAANGLEIGSKQYDRGLSWGLTSSLTLLAASPTGNSLVDLYSQNQAAASR